MAALEIFNSQCRGVAHGLTALSSGPSKRAKVPEARSYQLWSRCGGSFHLGITQLRDADGTIRRHHSSCGRRKTLKRMVVVEAKDLRGETDVSPEEKKTTKTERRSSEIRSKIADFLEKKSGYSWLLGPAAVTAAIVLPSTSVNLVSLFQTNFLVGLAATFALDILFVLTADLFLVLADKLGHHQQVSGGPPPWIGPWEYTGYPKGYPIALNYVTYASVGVAILAMVLSLFTGKLPGAVATFGPYLGLIFTQVAYERLLGNDRVPVFPLVPIVFTVYRFRQLSRALALLPFLAEGSGILSRSIHISSILWVLYLGMHLTQLPWLFSTWNANRST